MRRIALALVAAWAVAGGCRTVPEGIPLPREDPRASALLAALAVQGQQRNAVRATARVSLSGRHGASFARELLLLERPARLRVEVLGLLGQRVAVLATDGERYELYRSETGQIERGDVHPGILWEVAGVPLSPRDAVALLLGSPEADVVPTSALALEDGAIRVEWDGPVPGWLRSLEFDAGGRLRQYAVSEAEGETLLTVDYGDYRQVAGSDFAHRVDFHFPRTDARAEVAFRSVELNPPLADELFRLQFAEPGPEAAEDSP